MVDLKDDSSPLFDLDILRGWQKSQLKLLKEFASNQFVSQTRLSGASGLRQGSHELGGKITTLTRNNLILKAGKDENGQVWQLNEEKVNRKHLLDFVKKLGIK